MKAFSYAIEKLSTRFSESEAHRFWLAVFENAGFHIDSSFADPKPDIKYPHPRLPMNTNKKETIE